MAGWKTEAAGSWEAEGQLAWHSWQRTRDHVEQGGRQGLTPEVFLQPPHIYVGTLVFVLTYMSMRVHKGT